MNALVANDTLDKPRQLQRALYRAAKASPTRRFHALYDKVHREDILARAWQELKANAGAAGTDYHTKFQLPSGSPNPNFIVINSIDTADVISCPLRVDLPQAAAFEMQQPSTGARMPVAALGAP